MSKTEIALAKRRLALRDTLTFIVLTLITGALFLVTLFLFRSFTSHRAELAIRWSGRGREALREGKPKEAIVALRTGLSYAPGTRSYELLLAQALADDGRAEEASNYFMNLWFTQPGDGFINLELARLAARKSDKQNAVQYYRASIYGTWEGDGVVRRREVRLELARYLIEQHDSHAARIELLIAAGNSPGDPKLNLTLADLLAQTGDASEAFSYYQKVLQEDSKNQAALEGAGRTAYQLGNFTIAQSLLERALEARTSPLGKDESPSGELATLLQRTKRILELRLSGKLRVEERVNRILEDRTIARKRFDACLAEYDTGGLPASLGQLQSRWTSAEATMTRKALSQSLSKQDAAVQLIYDTELQSSQLCAEPTGDDALLLLLAKSPEVAER